MSRFKVHGFYYFAIVGNNNIANLKKKHQPVDSKLVISVYARILVSSLVKLT